MPRRDNNYSSQCISPFSRSGGGIRVPLMESTSDPRQCDARLVFSGGGFADIEIDQGSVEGGHRWSSSICSGGPQKVRASRNVRKSAGDHDDVTTSSLLPNVIIRTHSCSSAWFELEGLITPPQRLSGRTILRLDDAARFCTQLSWRTRSRRFAAAWSRRGHP